MNFKSIFLIIILICPLFSHGVSESTINAMGSASLFDFIYFGAEHMVTGYDHILFNWSVIFLTSFFGYF